MATPEIIINEYLGAELRRFHPKWQASGVVVCENTEAFFAKSQRPDLVVCDNPLAPVGIETEFAPGATVESDAISRLGKVFVPTGGKIHSVLAVRLPTQYRQLKGSDIAESLRQEEGLEYCLVSGASATEHSRWPAVGYVIGSVADLAYVISTAKTSPVTVDLGTTLLEEGARTLAAMLASAATQNPNFGEEIAKQLRQEAGPQTYTMAATILINAFVFQETIAGTGTELADVKTIYSLGKDGAKPTKMEVIETWDQILAINYWAIFGISKALITAIPTALWAPFVQACLATADQLLSLNLGKNPDLVGTIFQRLISDRRFLATFYTAPSSATLLARLIEVVPVSETGG